MHTTAKALGMLRDKYAHDNYKAVAAKKAMDPMDEAGHDPSLVDPDSSMEPKHGLAIEADLGLSKHALPGAEGEGEDGTEGTDPSELPEGVQPAPKLTPEEMRKILGRQKAPGAILKIGVMKAGGPSAAPSSPKAPSPFAKKMK